MLAVEGEAMSPGETSAKMGLVVVRDAQLVTDYPAGRGWPAFQVRHSWLPGRAHRILWAMGARS